MAWRGGRTDMKEGCAATQWLALLLALVVLLSQVQLQLHHALVRCLRLAGQHEGGTKGAGVGACVGVGQGVMVPTVQA